MVSPLAFFLAPALLLQSAAPAVLNPGYAALLRRYARGERKAAVAALGEWLAADLDRQVRALERAARDGPPCPGCADPLDGVPLKAAVMLHFDRGESERPR